MNTRHEDQIHRCFEEMKQTLEATIPTIVTQQIEAQLEKSHKALRESKFDRMKQSLTAEITKQNHDRMMELKAPITTIDDKIIDINNRMHTIETNQQALQLKLGDGDELMEGNLVNIQLGLKQSNGYLIGWSANRTVSCSFSLF